MGLAQEAQRQEVLQQLLRLQVREEGRSLQLLSQGQWEEPGMPTGSERPGGAGPRGPECRVGGLTSGGWPGTPVRAVLHLGCPVRAVLHLGREGMTPEVPDPPHPPSPHSFLRKHVLAAA